MKRDISLYLNDIIENMKDAEAFLTDISYEDFSNDKKTKNAVIRSIEIIGEAAKKIPEEIRLLESKVPWKDLAGMRDKCIHFYFGIDMRTVWLTVKEDIPQLRPLIQNLIGLIKH